MACFVRTKRILLLFGAFRVGLSITSFVGDAEAAVPGFVVERGAVDEATAAALAAAVAGKPEAEGSMAVPGAVAALLGDGASATAPYRAAVGGVEEHQDHLSDGSLAQGDVSLLYLGADPGATFVLVDAETRAETRVAVEAGTLVRWRNDRFAHRVEAAGARLLLGPAVARRGGGLEAVGTDPFPNNINKNISEWAGDVKPFPCHKHTSPIQILRCDTPPRWPTDRHPETHIFRFTNVCSCTDNKIPLKGCVDGETCTDGTCGTGKTTDQCIAETGCASLATSKLNRAFYEDGTAGDIAHTDYQTRWAGLKADRRIYVQELNLDGANAGTYTLLGCWEIEDGPDDVEVANAAAMLENNGQFWAFGNINGEFYLFDAISGAKTPLRSYPMSSKYPNVSDPVSTARLQSLRQMAPAAIPRRPPTCSRARSSRTRAWTAGRRTTTAKGPPFREKSTRCTDPRRQTSSEGLYVLDDASRRRFNIDQGDTGESNPTSPTL